MVADSPADFIREHKEHVLLVLYFVAIGALSVPLASLFRRGWRAGPGNLTQTLLASLRAVGISLALVQAVAFGVVIGLLVLLVVDQKKRVQGLLLWIGVALVGAGFVVQDFVPRLFRVSGPHMLGVLLGLVLVWLVAVPTGVTQSITRLERPTSLEFPRAATLMWALTTVAVVVFWVEAHVVYPPVLQAVLTGESLAPLPLRVGVVTDHILVDTVTAGALIWVTRRFMRYEATQSVIVIGPKNAGKTYTMYGAYLEWRDRHSAASHDPMDPSQAMSERIDEAETVRQQLTDGGATSAGPDVVPWTLGSTTGGVDELSFTITEGDVFPMAKTVTSLDYTGEALTALSQVVTGTPPEDVTDARPDVAQELHDHVEAADTLVFLLDVERILDEREELDAAPYLDIIRRYRDDKQLLFAATKADLLDEAYRHRRQRDPYSVDNLDDYAAFVTEEVTERSGLVRDIIQSGGVDTLHPVYLMTAEYDGERYPVKTGGSLSPFGYVRLLEEVQ